MQIHKDIRFQSLITRMEELYLEGRTDEMRPFLEQLQTLAETEQDDIGLAAAYFYLDVLSDKKPDSDDYMQYAKRTLFISKTKNIPYYEMKASNSLGIMYSEISDFHSSLECYLRAIHIAEEHPEFCYASVALNNVGNLFVWLEEYTEATSYLERAYRKGADENVDDRQLLALISLNLIEVWSYLENFGKVSEWDEKSQGFLDHDELVVVECIKLINEARLLLKAGQSAQVPDKMKAFLELSKNTQDYIYIFHCYINALRLGIQILDFPLCSAMMEKLEQLQEKSPMTSFAFDYASIRVEYYQAFPEQLAQYASAFFKDYFNKSQNRIYQLRNTYAKSLSMKIAFEEVKDENINVHQRNEQLQKDIERDIFTNLLNKVSTQKHVSAAMKERAAQELQALFLLDIDLFKLINDNYGHDFGDKVIVKVASVLETIEEPHKIVGRFGGDEFMVFLSKQDSMEVIQATIEKMQQQIRGCIQYPDERIAGVTTSVGVYIIGSDMKFEDAFICADQALYRAKELGRNRFVISGDGQ